MSRIIELLSPRLVGKRFENHAIPISFLKELPVLEKFILEVAKWIYKQDNPGRERSPRGFNKDIHLQVTRIDEGSAIPAISIQDNNPTLFESDAVRYYIKATDCIIQNISAAANDDDAFSYLPRHLMTYFDKFGRGLLEDESIDFRQAAPGSQAVLDKKVRKSLILRSSSETYTDSVDAIGHIYSHDYISNTFGIVTSSGKRLACKVNEDYLDEIIAAHANYENQYVAVKGIAEYNLNGDIKQIVEVEELEVLSPKDISVQAENLKKLSTGWLNGEGLPLEPKEVDWFVDRLQEIDKVDNTQLYLFPTTEGGIQVEWTRDKKEISLEIDLDNKEAYFHSWDSESDTDQEKELDLLHDESWKFIADQISGE